ncbi:MAG: rod shape-determining protein [Succinivibrionaceae bacterium]
MFKKLRSLFSNDLSIDLGTANTLIYVKPQGIVLNEPSVVAIKDERNKGRAPTAIAVGRSAKQMLGKAPDYIKVVRPMKDGVIADCQYTERMLDEFMKSISAKTSKLLGFIKGAPRVLVCVPYGSTPVERNAIRNSVIRSGASEVYLITEPMAAAIGAGLLVKETVGSMVVDIGGGTTEVAIISYKDIVYASSVRTGGDKFDQAIVRYIQDNHKLIIDEVTAESIKIKIGCCLLDENEGSDDHYEMEITGQSIIEQAPRAIIITAEEIKQALEEPIKNIIAAVTTALYNVPPALSENIFKSGMVVTGGGALLRNIDKILEKHAKIPVRIAEDPLTCVARGGGIALEQYDINDSIFE